MIELRGRYYCDDVLAGHLTLDQWRVNTSCLVGNHNGVIMKEVKCSPGSELRRVNTEVSIWRSMLSMLYKSEKNTPAVISQRQTTHKETRRNKKTRC